MVRVYLDLGEVIFKPPTIAGFGKGKCYLHLSLLD